MVKVVVPSADQSTSSSLLLGLFLLLFLFFLSSPLQDTVYSIACCPLKRRWNWERAGGGARDNRVMQWCFVHNCLDHFIVNRDHWMLRNTRLTQWVCVSVCVCVYCYAPMILHDEQLTTTHRYWSFVRGHRKIPFDTWCFVCMYVCGYQRNT